MKTYQYQIVETQYKAIKTLKEAHNHKTKK